MNKLKLKDYNLKLTLLGGQAFNFDFFPEEKTYYGFTQEKIIKIKEYKNDYIFWQTYPKNDDEMFLKNYLRLDVDYNKILSTINKDKQIRSAIKKFPNIRLLKQDFDQTLISYLISSVNNISSIRKSVRMLSESLGEKIAIDGKEFYLFPKTEKIAKAKMSTLLKCKLGFRAKYVKNAANEILKTNLRESIYSLSEVEARNRLTSMFGIGEKIADCILVFSLGFNDITPLDVWGKRVAEDLYNIDRHKKYSDIRLWFSKYFNGYSSWAAQYLYEYIRLGNRR